MQKVREPSFYNDGGVEEFETLRRELRGVIRFARKTVTPVPGPKTFDVTEEEDQIRVEEHTVQLKGLDLVPYRRRVESVLRTMIEKSELMRKVWMGESLNQEDISSLVEEVLLEEPSLDIRDLLVHFPNDKKSLELAIRQVIGLSPEKIETSLQSFLTKHTSLNANQMRFIELMKNYLSKNGRIDPEKLWEAPFTSIAQEGVDGVFTQDEQVDDLLELIEKINQAA